MSPERLTPRGLAAFARCLWWRRRIVPHEARVDAVRLAWHWGPVR